MASPSCRVQAFLAAGHVCSVMGMGEYPELAERYRVPIVVTGFEPLDILEGIRRTVLQLERGERRVDNAYPRAVPPGGQPGRAGHAGGRLRGDRPRLARHRGDPGQRLAALRRATATTTPSTASRSAGIDTEESRSAAAARCCRASSSRTSARPSARSARRATRSAPPWSPARARARRTTSTGGWARRPTSPAGGEPRCLRRSRRGPSARTSTAGRARSRCGTARRS